METLFGNTAIRVGGPDVLRHQVTLALPLSESRKLLIFKNLQPQQRRPAYPCSAFDPPNRSKEGGLLPRKGSGARNKTGFPEIGKIIKKSTKYKA